MTAPTTTAPPAPDIATLAALTGAQEASRQQAVAQLDAMVAASVAGFTAWYSSQAITAWATGLVADVEQYLTSLAGMTDAYMASLIGEVTGRWFRPTGTIAVDALRTGVTHAGAYGRVADTFRYQQSLLDQAAKSVVTDPNPSPPDLQSPLDAALERASQVVNLDAQLAVQHQSRATLQVAHEAGLVTGWRRVVHPEESQSGTSCGLCIAASQRVYHVDHLMPLHHDCHCQVIPVTATADVGPQLDAEAFARLYGDAGGTARDLLKKTRYTVTEHGELGPLLVADGAKQRTPGVVARATSDPTKPGAARSTPSGRRDKLQGLHDSLVQALSRADALAAENPTKWGSYRDTLVARVAGLESELANAA